MASKVLVGSLAGIFLVAAVVGTAIAVIRTSHKGPTDGDGGSLQTSVKTVNALCAQVAYPDVCQRTLGKVSSVSNSTDVIRAAVKATLDEIGSAFNRSDGIVGAVTDPNDKLAMQDCKDLLGYAVDELKAVFHEADRLSDRSSDLRSWTSAVITYQENCLDGLTLPDLKEQMQKNLQAASALTSNAMTIVTVLTAIARRLDPNLLKDDIGGVNVNRRRLLSEDGFPAWMSTGDRKLMASRSNARTKPDIVVAQDGSGNYRTINEAVNAVPLKNARRYTIYVKAGIYRETVIVKAPNVFMYGDGARNTRVTGSKHFPTPTMRTSTFAAVGAGFLCKGMGFFNDAGAKGHQAVALRVQSDQSAFFNCRMDGYQDTLYTQTHRQFYRNCVVSGTIDFIFGDAAAILQSCLIIIRRPMDNQFNTVTAQGRKQKDQPTGLVLQNCRIVPESALMADRLTIPSYYGRPWKPYARTVIMESTVGDVIRPEGWMMWEGANYQLTCYYAEYANRGPGAVTTNRVKWAKRSIERPEAMTYTAGPFLDGNTWLAATGGMFSTGLMY